MLGYESVEDDRTSPSPLSVPKRDSATAKAHRSAAQYGHHSAPTNTTRGFPSAVSASVLSAVGAVIKVPLPIVFSTEAGTVEMALVT